MTTVSTLIIAKPEKLTRIRRRRSGDDRLCMTWRTTPASATNPPNQAPAERTCATCMMCWIGPRLAPEHDCRRRQNNSLGQPKRRTCYKREHRSETDEPSGSEIGFEQDRAGRVHEARRVLAAKIDGYQRKPSKRGSKRENRGAEDEWLATNHPFAITTRPQGVEWKECHAKDCHCRGKENPSRNDE